MNWNRVCILALFDLKHSFFRLKGLVFLIPFLFFWYWILKFLWQQAGDYLDDPQSLVLLAMMFKPETIQALLINQPPTLSLFFIIMLGTLPLFVMLSGNDQLASDCGRKTFRLYLTRASRAEIFSGRLLGHYSLAAAAILVMLLLATLIAILRDPHSDSHVLQYAGRVGALSLLYLLPLTAYMSAVSALMSSALSSLLASAVSYFCLLLAGSYISVKSGMTIALVPGGVKQYLFDIQPGDIRFAVMVLLLYSVIYLSVGWLLFRRRNI